MQKIVKVAAVAPNQFARVKFVGWNGVVLLARFGDERCIDMGIEGGKID